MTFTETVKRVMELSEAIREYWDVELPKRHPNYPFIGEEGYDDGPPPPQEAELRDFLRSLPAGDIHKLVALVRLGWGQFSANALAPQLRALADEYPDPESAIVEMVGKGGLAADLEEGLEELARRGIDINGVTASAA